jgi:hypothetical protein
VFYIDVAKVDRYVAHVVMARHVCFKCMFQMFYLFRHTLQVFHLDVAKVYLNIAYICKCFRCFHTYVASVLSRCLQWLHTYFQGFLVFCKCFRHMLQVFQLFQMYIASVLSRCCESRSGVAHVAMRPTCRDCLLQLLGCHRGSPCGRLRPLDASAPQDPQVRAGDWDPCGFLRVDTVVRRKSEHDGRAVRSVGRTRWGTRIQAARASFTCSEAARMKGGVRYFRAAPDIRTPDARNALQ